MRVKPHVTVRAIAETMIEDYEYSLRETVKRMYGKGYVLKSVSHTSTMDSEEVEHFSAVMVFERGDFNYAMFEEVIDDDEEGY